MKSFQVPTHYRSSLMTAIKQSRKLADRMKKDFEPSRFHLGDLEVILPRHFGFCYGVENAIEIAFRAIEENRGKRILLLSEMIHNAGVNADLRDLGVEFIMNTDGTMRMDWSEISSDDIVIIPAFGTTVELEKKLRDKGIEPSLYETTCPFVEKVWNRAEKIGKEGYTIVVHGKPRHEETRATFSHSQAHSPTVTVRDKEQAVLLAAYIKGEKPAEEFYKDFQGQYSEGFDVQKDLQRIGVVNQTTMLASETQGISDYLKQVIMDHYQLDADRLAAHFADTRDTLCYATNDNQTAVKGMLRHEADLALVIGGYNSSNTSHLVELCEEKLPTYFIREPECLISREEIRHYDLNAQKEILSKDYLPAGKKIKIMVTSGASCPDSLVEKIILRVAEITEQDHAYDQLLADWIPPTS